MRRMQPDLDVLTPREREVLALMARGLTNGEIAEELGISFSTAKTHVSEIIRRLDVTSREEAVALYRREHSLASRSKRFARSLVPASLLGRLGLGAGLVSVAAVGAVTLAFASGGHAEPPGPPDPLVVALSDLEAGVPKELDVPGLGRSQFGTPYPLWVVKHDDGSVQAFLGRDPHSNCTVPWRPDYEMGPRTASVVDPGSPDFFSDGPPAMIPGFVGAFRGLCGGWVWTVNGEIVFGASPRGLDGYPVNIEGANAVVRFDQIVAGQCTPTPVPPCSPSRDVPLLLDELPPALVPDFGLDARQRDRTPGVVPPTAPSD